MNASANDAPFINDDVQMTSNDDDSVDGEGTEEEVKKCVLEDEDVGR